MIDIGIREWALAAVVAASVFIIPQLCSLTLVWMR